MPPPRNDIETTRSCPVCATRFTPVRRQLYCTPACRQIAWRTRHDGPAPASVVVLPARTRRRDVTVYECLYCETRLLGEQWCPDCQRPARRVDYGGRCPHCDEPVAVSDLTAQLPARPPALPPDRQPGP
jgi:hypothetical protein